METENKVNEYKYPYHWASSGFSKRAYEESYVLSRSYVNGKDVLDIGCGDGRLTYLLSQDARNITAFDDQKIAIGFAKSIAGSINPRIKFHVFDGRKIVKQWRGKFDVITSYDVIEHIPDSGVVNYLNSIKAYLKKDGMFVLTTPNIRELRGRVFGHKVNAKHYKEYTVPELVTLLRENGFDIVDLKGIYIPLPLPKIADYLLNIPPLNLFFYWLIKAGHRFPNLAHTIFIAARKR